MWFWFLVFYYLKREMKWKSINIREIMECVFFKDFELELQFKIMISGAFFIWYIVSNWKINSKFFLWNSKFKKYRRCGEFRWLGLNLLLQRKWCLLQIQWDCVDFWNCFPLDTQLFSFHGKSKLGGMNDWLERTIG